jgi:hypothetical protein
LFYKNQAKNPVNTTKKAFGRVTKGFPVKTILFKSDLAGARTQDPLIKSQMLYQLSYEIIPIKMPFSKGVAKIKAFFGLCKSPNSIFSFCS